MASSMRGSSEIRLGSDTTTKVMHPGFGCRELQIVPDDRLYRNAADRIDLAFHPPGLTLST